jgi:hypothetical protein
MQLRNTKRAIEIKDTAVVILVYSLYRGNTKRSGGISAPGLKQ